MTTPWERTRAVLQTREFLSELACASAKSGVPVYVRREATRLLRHYPSPSDMNIAHLGVPIWFGPTTKERS